MGTSRPVIRARPGRYILWPLEEQIDLSLGSVAGTAWLARVAAEAVARIELGLAPASNRGNEIAEALEPALVGTYGVSGKTAGPRLR